MKILRGDSLLDGGTTSIVFETDSQIQSLTISYSLPHDGRNRFIHLGNELFDYATQLEIGSAEENKILFSLKSSLKLKYGDDYLQRFLRGDKPNKGEKAWFFALHLFKMAYQEREDLR